MAINETDMGVWIIGLHIYDELCFQAEIRLSFKGFDVHGFDLVRRHHGLVECVKIKSKSREEEDQKKEETITAAYAFHTTNSRLLRAVLRNLAMVIRRWSYASIRLQLNVGRWWCVHCMNDGDGDGDEPINVPCKERVPLLGLIHRRERT